MKDVADEMPDWLSEVERLRIYEDYPNRIARENAFCTGAELAWRLAESKHRDWPWRARVRGAIRMVIGR